MVLTLPYAVMMPLMPRDRLGQFTGLFSVSRGAATLLAPIAFGAAIDAASAVMGKDPGYAIIWPLAAVIIVASLFLFRAVTSAHKTPMEAEGAAG